MFKVKVKSKLKAQIEKKMKGFVTERFASKVQEEIINQTIKPMIDAGVSPVQSFENTKRFKGYKEPEKYPNKRKQKRPVNLKLSGKMLERYRARKLNGTTVEMGILSSAPEDIKIRAEANNLGTVNERGEVAIAARRFIPIKGETFAVSVMRRLKDLYAKRLKEIL